MPRRKPSGQLSGFKPGDFVRMKRGPTGNVGVVFRIDRGKLQVHWPANGSLIQDHEPEDLELVPSNEAPSDAAEVRKNLRFSS